MVQIADRALTNTAQNRDAPQHAIAHDRPADARLGAKQVEVPGDEPRRRFDLVRGLPGNQIESAADRVAAVQRSLRAAEHLDALELQEVSERRRGASKVDTVDVDRRARIGSGKDDVGADATDRQLGKAGVLGKRERRRKARDVRHRVGLGPLQLNPRQHAQRHRGRLQISLACSCGGDQRLLLQQDRKRERKSRAVAGQELDHFLGGRKPGGDGGQFVLPLGQIGKLEAAFRIRVRSPGGGSRTVTATFASRAPVVSLTVPFKGTAI